MSSGRRPAPLLVEATPPQREAEPLFVGLDEAPQKRCLLGSPLSPLEASPAGVADEPIGTRVPGNAQGVAIVLSAASGSPASRSRSPREWSELAGAEVIVRADREIGGLAQQAPAAIEVADGGRLLALQVQDAPETSG